MYFLLCILFIFDAFLVNSSYEKSFWSFVFVIFLYVGAGITTLMSISDGLDPYLFLLKGGKDAVYEKKMDEEAFISRQK